MAMRKKILVVDDSPFFLERMKDLLLGMNFSVVTCDNGQKAVKIIVRDHDNLGMIITDLQMPEMDGFKFLKWLKDQPYADDMPVLVLTGAYDLTEIVGSLNEYGVRGLLDKGSHPHHLISRINTILFPEIVNKRKHERVSVHLPVSFECENDTKSAIITNLSLGGCFLFSKELTDSDVEITINVKFPDINIELSLKGRVVWSLGGKDWQGKQPSLEGMGVHWVDLTSNDKLILESYIGEKLKEERLYDMLLP